MITDFIKNRKTIVLAAGIFFMLMAIMTVFMLAARGCSEHENRPGDPFAEATDNPGTGEHTQNPAGNNQVESGDNKGGETVPGHANETGNVEVKIPPGVTDLKVLRNNLVSDKSTNILILGEDQLYSLMDTIGIISIDKESKKIKIIMIPRDTYIQYNDRVLAFMEAYGKINEPGVLKINYAYYLGWYMHDRGWELDFEGRFDNYSYGVSFMAQVIKEKFDITIHDFIHINTEVFAEVVDLFGGVDIYVPYDMHYEDPDQDLYIHLEEGEHHLDGKMAEGFVRFRTGVDDEGNVVEYGDIERKKNQIAFLKAFFEQHGTLGNLDKIPSFLDTLGKRVRSSIKATDVLFRYIGLAKDIVIDKYPIEDYTLVGAYKMIDGVSYIVFE